MDLLIFNAFQTVVVFSIIYYIFGETLSGIDDLNKKIKK